MRHSQWGRALSYPLLPHRQHAQPTALRRCVHPRGPGLHARSFPTRTDLAGHVPIEQVGQPTNERLGDRAGPGLSSQCAFLMFFYCPLGHQAFHSPPQNRILTTSCCPCCALHQSQKTRHPAAAASGISMGPADSSMQPNHQRALAFHVS